MAGLSSIMAITRPLGEVNLADMNRCTGIYRVYLNGGGGGGGGYDDFYTWYGGRGSYAAETTYTGSLVPPITLTAGYGGSAGSGYAEKGQNGGTTSMGDSRVPNIILPQGGVGGTSASTEKSLVSLTAVTRQGTVNDRFAVSFRNYSVGSGYFTITTGRGGGSMRNGNAGGIIKAFRIG